MFTPLFLKNKNYEISRRDYTFDYAKENTSKINMTLSGSYLSNYSKSSIDWKKFDQYPSHDDIQSLISKIKEVEKTDREIIIGAGANGILQNLVKMLFRYGGNLVTPYHTFDEAEFAVTSFGGFTKRVYMNDFEIDFSNLYQAIDSNTKMVYLCNPNNPTGIVTSSSKILDFARRVRVFVVVDESGIEFTNEKSLLSFSDLPDNLLVIRSFSKAYGLANLRIGYLGCTRNFQNSYVRHNTIHEVNGFSVFMALSQLKNKKNVQNNIRKITFEREKIIKEFHKLGILCTTSQSNVIFTKTTFPYYFIESLKKSGISVVTILDKDRNIHIRIAIQEENLNRQFLEVFFNIYQSIFQ